MPMTVQDDESITSTMPPKLSTRDGILIVAQKNASREISIVEANSYMVRLLGFPLERLREMHLTDLLLPEMRDEIVEDIEFEMGGSDIADQLRRFHNLTLVGAKSEQIPVAIKVHSVGVQGTDPMYEIVVRPDVPLPEEGLRRRREKGELAKQMALKGHEQMDPALGIPDRTSFEKDLELVLHHMKKEKAKATLVLVMLNRQHDAYAEEALRKIANACVQTFRREDTVALFSKESLGLILLDTDKQNAVMPLHRVRKEMGLQLIPLPGGEFAKPTVVMATAELKPKDEVKKLMIRCDTALVNDRSDANISTIINLA